MNLLINRFAILAALAPLSACSSHFDRSINPPADTHWVTLSVKVPQDTETLPMDVLYRSQVCQEAVYDNLTESHVKPDPAHSPHDVSLVQQGSSDIWQARIALDGGGKCQWKLSVIRMRMQFKPDSPLAKGKDTIPASFAFSFDEQGTKSSFIQDTIKEVYGDQHLKIEFFPEIFINNMFNKTTIKLFGGNTKKSEWSRDFKVHNTTKIFIEPVVNSLKVVTIESPNSQSVNMTITYPDGSVIHSDKTYPDYEKLRSMK